MTDVRRWCVSFDRAVRPTLLPIKAFPRLEHRLRIGPEPPSTADVSNTSLRLPATCLLSSRSISPAEAATAASLSAAGLDGTVEDVALAMGRFAERLSLNSINHEAGSKKPKYVCCVTSDFLI